MSRTLNSSAPMWPETSRSESHLLVVTALPDDPNTDELVAVAISIAVDVTGGSVIQPPAHSVKVHCLINQSGMIE
jgi:hypothetical protein